MPSAETSAGLKAIRYAEDNLNVHGVYDEAQAARGRLDDLMTEIAGARDQRREAEEALRDREMELAADEWANHPEFSATKMDGHLKTVRHNDGFHRAARDKVAKIVSDIEGLEYDIRLAEVDIRIAVARLHELGGYFEYLAAIKQAAKSNNT